MNEEKHNFVDDLNCLRHLLIKDFRIETLYIRDRLKDNIEILENSNTCLTFHLKAAIETVVFNCELCGVEHKLSITFPEARET